MNATLTLALLASVLFFATSTPVHAAEKNSVDLSFSSYEEAVRFVRNAYLGQVLRTPDNTAIKSFEYYWANGGGYLVVAFQGDRERTYLYRGVPVVLWKELVKAGSRIDVYNHRIKGRKQYSFKLNRD